MPMGHSTIFLSAHCVRMRSEIALLFPRAAPDPPQSLQCNIAQYVVLTGLTADCKTLLGVRCLIGYASRDKNHVSDRINDRLSKGDTPVAARWYMISSDSSTVVSSTNMHLKSLQCNDMNRSIKGVSWGSSTPADMPRTW